MTQNHISMFAELAKLASKRALEPWIHHCPQWGHFWPRRSQSGRWSLAPHRNRGIFPWHLWVLGKTSLTPSQLNHVNHVNHYFSVPSSIFSHPWDWNCKHHPKLRRLKPPASGEDGRGPHQDLLAPLIFNMCNASLIDPKAKGNCI